MENTVLINNMLEKYYIKNFQQANGSKHFNLFLLASCNNNCSYCYLKKHGKQLYPKHLEDYDTIYQNLQLILNWYIENNFRAEIDLFSGEWLTLKDFSKSIFDIFYNTFKEVDILKRPSLIAIPDNMQFILDDELIDNVQSFIDNMKTLGVRVAISASIDGLIIEKYRKNFPSDEYYKKIFDFLTKNSCFCHPMISAENVKYWKENYLWWKQNAPSHIQECFGALEVRNNEWNLASINEYLDFLNFLIEDRFNNKFNKNKINMLKEVLRQVKNPSQLPHVIYPKHYYELENSCSFYSALTIRVGDLSIAPCHRLFYPELIIGKFSVINNKIDKLIPEHPELFILKEHSSKQNFPHCENCQFNYLCMGHCLGAAYECYDNPLIPPKSVCDLLKAKYSFLIIKYQEMGLWDYLDYVLDPKDFKSIYLKQVIENVLEGAIHKGIYIPKEISKNE